ncbi:putative MFS transporter [Leucosporidium creatinivorum]|uniref:Putative MFS transporter n=1 Tax=Leucosporidium creatinivorum TaxID=106004 RepID=A0A1Y2EZ72_9BASI|nr:putative MFS transporter [Leucosporidium creatinivorum]
MSLDYAKPALEKDVEQSFSEASATPAFGRPQPLTPEQRALEAKLARKIDFRIVPIVFILYLFCFIDRANIGNARLAGLEADLGLKGNDYNTLLSVFYVSYIAFEIPSNLLLKIVGPGRYIPLMVIVFGGLSIATGFVTSLGSACAVRFLLGAAESAMLPGCSYYLSRWYRKSELVFRLSLFLVASPLAGAFGGLLASGILKIDSIGSATCWQLIFIIEGIITVGLGAIAYFILTDRPAVAGWLTEEEKALAEHRIRSENTSGAAVEGFNRRGVMQGIFHPSTMVLTLIFLLNNITVQGLAVFLPTIVRILFPGSSTIRQQLLCVPPNIVGGVAVLTTAFCGWKFDRRGAPLMAGAVLVVIGYSIFVGTNNLNAQYGATFMIASGCFSFGAIVASWAAANVASDTSRAAAIATVAMGGNTGGLIATWSFISTDAPRYIKGNSLNLATGATTFLVLGGFLLYLRRENQARDAGKKDHLIEGLSQEEQEQLGTDHPSFRYKY